MIVLFYHHLFEIYKQKFFFEPPFVAAWVAAKSSP